MGFDIERLLDFEPADYRCVKCLALLPGPKDGDTSHKCPICDLTAIRSAIVSGGTITTFSTQGVNSGLVLPTSYDRSALSAYAYGYGSFAQSALASSTGYLLPVTFNQDAMDHAKELAGFARLLRSVGDQPTLRVLVDCLLQARSFVHFTTFGISQAMLGVLAAVSEFVPVAGIASAVDGNTAKEIEKLRHDFPRLDIRPISKQGGDSDQIHVKLIVIDGLLALSGSPNLTTDAWRKTVANKERVDIVTDVQRVQDDNNRYFSSHWATLRTEFDPSQIPLWGWNLYQPDKADSGTPGIDQ